MPKIAYRSIKFSDEAMDAIVKANRIIDQYAKQGFGLTLRQLYYVFVGKDWFSDARRYRPVPGTNKYVKDPNGTKNTVPNYKWLGDIISDGRMGGLVDWEAIADRTRESLARQHWTRPSQIIEGAMNSYEIDKWNNQPNYVEVWVEKQALEQVVGSACGPLDVRYFACKGYTSQSAMWEASQRLLDRMREGKEVHIIHLGDHDPSGIDMSRDIEEKLELFTDSKIHLERIALNMNQVQQYNLPSDPAKATDSRFAGYQAIYGDDSWELDALDPPVLVSLIEKSIMKYRDETLWKTAEEEEAKGKGTLKYLIQYFPDVVKFLRERRKRDDSPVICTGCGATEANPTCSCDTKNRGILL